MINSDHPQRQLHRHNSAFIYIKFDYRDYLYRKQKLDNFDEFRVEFKE